MYTDPFIPENILLMCNIAIPKAQLLGKKVHQFLTERGAQHQMLNYNFEHSTNPPDLSGHDMLIVLGGDGTLLRAGHMAAPLGIPILGVQAGRLGFLVELNENDWADLLPRLFSANYRFENRMMLTAEFIRGSAVTGKWDVLNEIAVVRGSAVHPIEIRVDLNEGYMTSYIADGLIVSTATGSTAYALAAGGPILPPELRNMLILPIAPHLSLSRAVILAEGATVILRAKSDFQALMSVDGLDPIPVLPEDSIRITSNGHSLQMVRFGTPNYFYKELADVTRKSPILRLTE